MINYDSSSLSALIITIITNLRPIKYGVKLTLVLRSVSEARGTLRVTQLGCNYYFLLLHVC